MNQQVILLVLKEKLKKKVFHYTDNPQSIYPSEPDLLSADFQQLLKF